MHKSEYQSALDILAENIKAKRSVLGISQEELALRSSVDRTFVSKIERAIANPSLKTIYDIAVVLDISLSELFQKVEREK